MDSSWVVRSPSCPHFSNNNFFNNNLYKIKDGPHAQTTKVPRKSESTCLQLTASMTHKAGRQKTGFEKLVKWTADPMNCSTLTNNKTKVWILIPPSFNQAYHVNIYYPIVSQQAAYKRFAHLLKTLAKRKSQFKSKCSVTFNLSCQEGVHKAHRPHWRSAVLLNQCRKSKSFFNKSQQSCRMINLKLKIQINNNSTFFKHLPGTII